MSIPEDRLHELYEIADGAYGDGPWMRGLAINRLRKEGYEYPAREVTDLPDEIDDGNDLTNDDINSGGFQP